MKSKYIESLLASKQKIALYGLSIGCERIFNELPNEKISFIIDKKYVGNEFHGKKIYSLDEVDTDTLKSTLIIVSVMTERTYHEIAKLLRECDLVEYIDFIWESILGKEIAILYGNCHMYALREKLLLNPEFTRKYACLCWNVRETGVNELIHKLPLPDEFIEQCSLLICQDIREENYLNVLSADKVENMFSDHCTKVRIPNTYGFCTFFPQTKQSIYLERYYKHDRIDGKVLINPGFSTDSHIDEMYINGFSIRDIANSIENEDIFHGCMNEFMEKIDSLHQRENKCDIQIAESIKANYQKSKLFYDPCHPSGILHQMIAMKVIKVLGFSPTFVHGANQLDNKELFIYGCVRKQLGMEFEQRYIRNNIYLNTLKRAPMTLEDFIEQYIIWNWGAAIEANHFH